MIDVMWYDAWKHKQRLRKLWLETGDPASKTAVNCVTKWIRPMTRRKALERWETTVGNCEVRPQALWPIAKSLMERDIYQRHQPQFMDLWWHPAAHITYTLSCKTEIASPAVSFLAAMTTWADGNGRTVSTFLATRTSRNISTDLD
jgi:hypothetical protein